MRAMTGVKRKNHHYLPLLLERGCRHTFNDLIHTRFGQSKRSLAHWILATFLQIDPDYAKMLLHGTRLLSA